MSGFNRIVLPFFDWLNRTAILKNIAFLNQSQWWTTSKLKELQEEKLKQVITAAYYGVPYYNNLFKNKGLTEKDIQSIDDLEKVPILEKSTLRNNWHQFINQNHNPKDAIKSFTSGSTGVPMKFLINREQESWRWASRYRFWQWAGYKLGQPYANISVHPRNKWIKKVQDKITSCTYLHLRKPDPNQFYDFLTKIAKEKINFLVGYAHSVYLLAHFAKQKQIEDIKLKGIVTHGETLFPHFRKLIENRFGCRVFDLYGAGGEGFHIASQCEYKNGYHINMENIIIETKEISNGFSEIILTGLDNTLMPLIRYNIKDLGNISFKSCSCGRGLVMLEKLNGRAGDLIITPNNKYLSALFFNLIFEQKKGIEQFQVIQKIPETILVKFIPNSNFLPKELDEIEQEILEAIDDKINIKFDKVSNIPVSSSGKHRWVISYICNFTYDEKKFKT